MIKHSLILPFIFLFAFTHGTAAEATPADQKRQARLENIRQIIVLSGEKDQVISVFENSGTPGTKPETDPDIQFALASLIDAYDQHLTDDDIAGTLAFYQTLPGRALATARPKITAQISRVLLPLLLKKAKQERERMQRELSEAQQRNEQLKRISAEAREVADSLEKKLKENEGKATTTTPPPAEPNKP